MKIYLFFLSILFVACNSNRKVVVEKEAIWSELPTVELLEKYKQTDFSRTLEDTINKQKNTVYTPTLLFAWDKIEEAFNSPITLKNSNSTDLKKLVSSQSHLNSLLDSEYSTTVKFDGNAIIAEAFFNKTLPFQTKLQLLENPISFKSVNVTAFGMKTFDEEIATAFKILYYESDNHLILKLLPKDTQHEIILVKGLDNYATLAEAVNYTFTLIKKGKSKSVISKNY